MQTGSRLESLLGLMKDARSGELMLPQFQRNFVWAASDITDLLVSILKGYYIGTFLLLRTTPDDAPFAMRPLEGVTLNGEDSKTEKMILDGQQRLTSLNYVFSAPPLPLRWTKYPYRFFLDLRRISEGDIENCIWCDRTDQVMYLAPREQQYKEWQLPFTEIEQWKSWLEQYDQQQRNKLPQPEYYEFLDVHKKKWDAAVQRILDAQVTTITIDKIDPGDQEEVAQVCAIFEKMNSTGVRLSVYDLLTARLFRHKLDDHKIDLHQLWNEAVETHSRLREMSDGKPDDYGVYVLRTLAMLRDLDVKSRTLINLSYVGFEADWRRATQFAEKALQRMADAQGGFGAFVPKWMPYSTMVASMGAFLAHIDAHKLGHQAYDHLARWYWASVFLERYAGSVESTTYRDFQDLVEVSRKSEFEPISFRDAEQQIVNNPGFTLRNQARVNSIYRGVMCLIALKGARDFASGDSIAFHDLDDHHIFPKAYLEKQRDENGKPRYSLDQVNSILNRTLISADTNRSISRKSPSDYLGKVVPAEKAKGILASHFIDDDARSAMEANDYEAFLAARERALVAEIRRRLQV